MYIQSLEFCVKIVTGSGKDGGTLKLSINNALLFGKTLFKRNQVVINKCFSSLDSITIQNPAGGTNKAWVGYISVTKNGMKKDLSCTGCTGNTFNGKIVVDGNQDAKQYASTYCINGKSCSFEIPGKTRQI